MISKRGQSDLIGSILLLSLITLTVSGVGVFALSQWQEDIGDEPVANIESEMTPVNITLQHRGGKEIHPENTTIRLVGVSDSVELENELYPGGRQSLNFKSTSGTIQVYIIDNSSGTVLHSATHTVRNPFAGLFFSVDGWTEPVYLLEGHPAKYSVEKEYKFGSPDLFTDSASVSIDDGSISRVDEEDTEITGLQTGETSLTVQADGSRGETQVVVLESDPTLDIESDVTTTGVKSADLDMDLIDLAGLPEVSLTAEYWPSHVFDKNPNNNSDFVLADGVFYKPPDYRDEPAGYTHNEGYVHDNVPLDEGETRTYTFFNPDSGADYGWYLRDGPQEGTGDGVDNFVRPYVRDYGNNVPDGKYRVEVTLSEDGSSLDVVLFNAATGGTIVREDRDIDVSEHDKLYYSSLAYFGTDYNRDSLRLTGIDTYSDNRTVQVESKADIEQLYTESISDLDINRDYRLTASGEQDIGGQTVSSTEQLGFGTRSQTIETVGVDILGPKSVDATGELVDLGDVNQTDLAFNYWPSRFFNQDPSNNSDYVVSGGGYYTPYDDDEPSGYIHQDGFIHDNVPLDEGETRTYTFYDPGSGADYAWYIRDGKQTDPDGRIENDVRPYVRGYDTSVPNEDYRVEVTLSDDGNSLDVVLFDEATGGSIVREDRDIDVSDHDELYFSSLELFGTDYYRSSLRLTGIDTFTAKERVTTESDVAVEKVYSDDIDGFEPDRHYRLTAYTEAKSDGVTVSDIGKEIEFVPRSPSIETVAATVTGATSFEAKGELVDLGDVDFVDIFFEYRPSRYFNADPTNNSDFVLGDGGYYNPYDEPGGYTHEEAYIHDNVPLTPGVTRTYTFYDPGSGAKYAWHLRDGKQEEPNGGVDNFVRPYVRDYYTSVPDGAYRVEVTLSDDGNTLDVVLFDEPTGGDIVKEDRGLDVSEHEELYFSSYSYFGNDYYRSSLRLTGIDEYENTETIQAASATTNEKEYTEEISGLKPDRDYVLTAYAESNYDGVNDSGDQVGFSIRGPTVETLDAVSVSSKKVNLTGELVELGDLQQTDLYFDYWQSYIFNGNSTNDSDYVLGDGSYYAPSDEPNGYTHEGGFIHDNLPLDRGETRTYTFYNPGSGADYSWYLRDGKQTDPDGRIENDVRPYVRGYDTSVPNGDYRVEVTLSGDGNSLDVVLFDEATGGSIVREDRDIDVSDHDELYFSSLGLFGTDYYRSSLRLTGIDTFTTRDQIRVAKDVTTEQTFTKELKVDSGRGYRYYAYSEEAVDSIKINSTGEIITFRNGG